MLNEIRTVCFDEELKIEAYNFKGYYAKISKPLSRLLCYWFY